MCIIEKTNRGLKKLEKSETQLTELHLEKTKLETVEALARTTETRIRRQMEEDAAKLQTMLLEATNGQIESRGRHAEELEESVSKLVESNAEMQVR